MKYEDNLLSDVGEEIACTSSKGAKGQKTSNNAKAASSDRRPASHSRRKQDLSTIRENSDEIMIVRYSSDEASLSNDLSEIPVCFTEKQRDLFLSLIRPASSLNDDASNAHTRMQCGDIIANISVRGRHSMSHLRIIHLHRSFIMYLFLYSDIQIHLSHRHCDKLHFASRSCVLPGNVLLCCI
uniref:PDZ domain-containing protein n=1 Tax=Elaeophora elaphi TaxID=1147741 RepID=A0A0R3S7I5_9BILA